MALLDTIVLVGLMLQSAPAGEPQGTPPVLPGPPKPWEPRDPALERIRKRLAEPAPLAGPSLPSLFAPPRTRPLFQVEIQGEMPPWDWLDDGTSVPAYVRPTYPPTHHEFMLAVTPELFRGVSTHPYGVPVLSIARVVTKALREQNRRRKEDRARREVQEALADLAAARAKTAEKER